LGIFLRGVKVQPADGILHVQLVLEGIGDGLGRAHEEKIVGHPVGVGGLSRGDAQAGQELKL
jgi:hypothetical protein